MKIYNTLTRNKDELTPQHDNLVTMYSCGPTVYDALTIGNWTAYIRWDILARTVKISGYNLKWYMNITDVGHLVSDADEGEDKLEKGARREGISAWDVAKKYTNDFKKGLEDLHIDFDINNLVLATDHIDDQIALIKLLEKKGHTYIIDDGVYFDSSTYPDYGKMAKLDLKGLKAGARVNIGHKRSSTDFALWKFSSKSQKRDMEWDSPWGKGFPGWHIECSAMAMKYLGDTIDIHTGGIDHIPVHHTNEIAQSESATGQQFAKFWIHSNFLKVDGQKISKSIGNVFTLSDLLKHGFSPMDFKFFVLQSSFQNEANFTWDGLRAAKNRLKALQAFADLRFQPVENGLDIDNILEKTRLYMNQSLKDNINTPKVMSILSKLIDEVKQPISVKSVESLNRFIKYIDDSLGLTLGSSNDISNEIKNTFNKRVTARKNQDWASSDELKLELEDYGIEIRDTEKGTIWNRI